ncbi:hypothetical protein K435DRAFT_859712 [Dendrothele bispora CBS 962.96]|uniref:Uncharacterized protein n=1 Tax=Dendrothele bispora (strain CBS 962.96) TaxID=1314807 RepID=A0A4S8LZR4_DENBC|nr:hypothetical protein K435DRAFT_859712 [Dendrothele bispora CBS 962.96]
MSTRASVDELKSDFNCLSRVEQQQLSPIAHKQAGSYGWKGEWNVDNMEVVIQKLRGLKMHSGSDPNRLCAISHPVKTSRKAVHHALSVRVRESAARLEVEDVSNDGGVGAGNPLYN